jgi:CRP-like cAMP-binding protein
MENELLKIIAGKMPLTDELKQIIEQVAVIKSYKKGTIRLLKEGEIANEQYIVFKGCIRSYVLVDGEEKTLEFYTEGDPVNPIAYDSDIPSSHYLECIEETVVCVNSSQLEKETMLKYPQLKAICGVKGKVSEDLLSNNQSSFAKYRILSAEERYLKLIEDRPELIQRVPQYLSASYLGIKPGSLSRIRSRLYKK